MLQAISPGELQSAENALAFGKELVTVWLITYKFKNWKTHTTTGKPVTDEERKATAESIAEELCNHRKWLTHRRSIKIDDLEAMGLRITDYSKNKPLAEAVRRYHTLLQMTFDSTDIYKLFETPTSQIQRFTRQAALPTPQTAVVQQADSVVIDVKCNKCQAQSKVQANLTKCPLQPGVKPFPKDNKLRCPTCGTELDLTGARRQIEMQFKRPVIEEYA
jgi:hypothetical protein